jgi:NADH dehydrogenase FAD-containing subunit
MLAASAVGTVETSSITESIKQANPHVLYVQGSVRAVDAESRSITIETASSLSARGEAATETVELDYTTLVSALFTFAHTSLAVVAMLHAVARHSSKVCLCRATLLQ